jgi:uncharacterized protein involved in exopolysaccharide biosynthesis
MCAANVSGLGDETSPAGDSALNDRPGDGPPGGPYGDDISLLEVVNLVLRHRYRIAGTAVVFGAITVLVTLLIGRTYAASSSFVPQGSDGQQGRLATLAGQFGVNVPMGDGASESPAFYAELLRSREILRPVARARYEIRGPGRGLAPDERMSGTLPAILGIDDEPDEMATLEAMAWLREEAIRVRTDAETGIVTVTVETHWAELSHAITERLVQLVNAYNLETRQSQAAAERVFLEERLGEAQDSLRNAEGRLETFLQGNRQFENSPELNFQHDRLQRQVARNQQLVTSLDQAYEEARVREVRNIPVITVVELPERPLRPEPRGLALKGALALLLGGLLGLFMAFVTEMLRRERERASQTYTEFHALWKKTWYDVITLGGRIP